MKIKMKTFLKEWGVFIVIVALAILSRIFIWQPVLVDGHSMDPTLADRERLIVVRTAPIQRFDIVIANEKDTNGETKQVVKRVIGLPGDTLKFDHDQLTINGKIYNEPYLANFQAQLKDGTLAKTYAAYPPTSELSKSQIDYFVQLAQHAQAFTTDTKGNPVFEVKVPKGKYYLLGDNRVLSRDSRAVGSFSRSDIIGDAKLRIWPLNKISFLN